MACIFNASSPLAMAAYFLYNVALEDGMLCPGTRLETPEDLRALEWPECLADFLRRLEERIDSYREEDADFYFLECLDPAGNRVDYIGGMRLLEAFLSEKPAIEPLAETMAALKFVRNS